MTLDPFRIMTHWHTVIPSALQKQIFERAGESFFYTELVGICAVHQDEIGGSPERLADKLQQRWRKAGLVKYGDGKWWKMR